MGGTGGETMKGIEATLNPACPAPTGRVYGFGFDKW